MRIIKESRITQYIAIHPDAAPSLVVWKREARHARWRNLADLRRTFRSADLVGKLTVFNIKGNDYRLISYIDYRHQLIFIRHFLTHAEYAKGTWKNDSWKQY